MEPHQPSQPTTTNGNATAEELETAILSAVHDQGQVDSLALATAQQQKQQPGEGGAEGTEHEEGTEAEAEAGAATRVDHQRLVGLLKSLAADGLVELRQLDRQLLRLTAEGREVLARGSPEALLWALLTPKEEEEGKGEGSSSSSRKLSVAEIEAGLGGGPETARIAMAKLAGRLVREKVTTTAAAAASKDNGVTPTAVLVARAPGACFEDSARLLLEQLAALGPVEPEEAAQRLGKAAVDELRRRRLVQAAKATSFVATPGPRFALRRTRQATELTREMLLDGSWRQLERERRFRPANLLARGKQPDGGHLHPLLKLRQAYREIFLELGFREMDTARWVESSFWNFDTLFVPQNHPAREMQDTYFVADPPVTDAHPPDYLQRVAKMHSEGDFGSLGHRSPFSVELTSRNVLRTHTTACSSRTLYHLAQQGSFQPGKYFSIDRVFRNERMDRTHLCEFFQIEGFIVDYGLSLANMMQVLEEFFLKVGVKKLRFKPTYNPYTEPSMEIFGFHEGLNRWIEVGNSGVFRPEMLRPMGFDEGVAAIAWGLSLERPAMMAYALNDIHKLEGPEVDLGFIRSAPLCRT